MKVMVAVYTRGVVEVLLVTGIDDPMWVKATDQFGMQGRLSTINMFSNKSDALAAVVACLPVDMWSQVVDQLKSL